MTSRLWVLYRCTPLKLLMGVSLLSLLLQESFFPFSNFPMYSKFDPKTWYVYVSDLENRPIALRRTYRTSSSYLKKVQHSKTIEIRDEGELDPERVEERAGLRTLEFLIHDVPQTGRSEISEGLRLWKVDLSRKRAHVERRERLLAEVVRP